MGLLPLSRGKDNKFIELSPEWQQKIQIYNSESRAAPRSQKNLLRHFSNLL